MAVPLLFLILVSYPELVLSETLTVTTIESEPFLRKHDDGKLSGYCYDLAQKVRLHNDYNNEYIPLKIYLVILDYV